MSRTREDRIERQGLDDGDPDDTVYTATGGHNGNRKTYHDDENCARFKSDGRREMTREGAQRRWLSPCMVCVVGGGGSSGA